MSLCGSSCTVFPASGWLKERKVSWKSAGAMAPRVCMRASARVCACICVRAFVCVLCHACVVLCGVNSVTPIDGPERAIDTYVRQCRVCE